MTNTIFEELDTPCLLIEKTVLSRNITEMQQIAEASKIMLRPHVKTHKSPVIALMQLAAGASGIAVAKLGEAEVMANRGISDIQIANVIVGSKKHSRLVDLASRAERITCCVDSIESAAGLSKAFAEAGTQLGVFVEINTGLHRCGLNDFDEIARLCNAIVQMDSLRLCGLLTHAGHAYWAAGIAEVEKIGIDEGRAMVGLAERLRLAGIEIAEISAGSTPTVRYCATVEGVTEIRPGNYVFHDMIQCSLGVTSISNCSLSVLSTVISTPAAGRAVIDAGSKALGLDRGTHGAATIDSYGFIHNKNAKIVRLSEEHGVIHHDNEKFTIGERLRIVPNHACAVVNLYDHAYLVDGSEVIEKIDIEARGKSV